MKRLIAFVLTVCMVLSFCVFGSTFALAADWELPAGTPMYTPGCVMETDFGSFTVLDAGFCKKATFQTGRTTGNDNSPLANSFVAGDGYSLFAVKGCLHNTSDAAIDLEELKPVITYGLEDSKVLQAYVSLALGQEEYSTLLPGNKADVILTTTIPNAVYFGNKDILLSLSGSELGFSRSGLMSYVSLGYEENDGMLTEDVTTISIASLYSVTTVQEKQIPHIDELTIEDAYLEYNPKATYEYKYRFFVKVRFNYMIPEGTVDLRCYIWPQFLDQDGTVMPSNGTGISTTSTLSYSDLEPGQASWNYEQFNINPDKFDVVKSIKLSSYTINYKTANGYETIKGIFSEPVIFSIDDLLAGEHPWLKEEKDPTISIDNVSLDYTDSLPASITNSGTYKSFANAKKDWLTVRYMQ